MNMSVSIKVLTAVMAVMVLLYSVNGSKEYSKNKAKREYNQKGICEVLRSSVSLGKVRASGNGNRQKPDMALLTNVDCKRCEYGRMWEVYVYDDNDKYTIIYPANKHTSYIEAEAKLDEFPVGENNTCVYNPKTRLASWFYNSSSTLEQNWMFLLVIFIVLHSMA